MFFSSKLQMVGNLSYYCTLEKKINATQQPMIAMMMTMVKDDDDDDDDR